jgi:hypothetical protein
MMNLGDVDTGATIHVPWSSNGADGASITRATDGSIRVYKDNSTTQRSSSAGITDSEDFDSITGVHLVTIDLSDNTDAGFYAAGHNYHVMLVAATIDGKTVNSWLATFSIRNRYSAPSGTFTANVTQWNGVNVASPHTAGYPVVTIKDGTGTGELDTASGAVAAVASVVAIGSGAITSASFAAGAINAAAIAADAITAAKVASDVGAEIADAVCDEALSGHTTAGTVGKALADAGAAGTPPTAAEIADMVATRGSANWENDVEVGSIGQAALEATHNGDTTTNAGYVTIFAADGVTPLYKRLLATDTLAAPLTGVGQRGPA